MTQEEEAPQNRIKHKSANAYASNNCKPNYPNTKQQMAANATAEVKKLGNRTFTTDKVKKTMVNKTKPAEDYNILPHGR